MFNTSLATVHARAAERCMHSRLMAPEYMMSRYFPISMTAAQLDSEGTELRDIYAAQEEALRLSGELLREMDGKFWNGEE